MYDFTMYNSQSSYQCLELTVWCLSNQQKRLAVQITVLFSTNFHFLVYSSFQQRNTIYAHKADFFPM